MEDWTPLQDYPGYSANRLGKIRNDKRSTELSRSQNQSGVCYVSLMRNGIQVKRSLAKLICELFVPVPTHRVPFTTPINLDGDATNCRADNLLWRPRWFALKYAKQFARDLPPLRAIRNTKNGEMFKDVWTLVTTQGLLYTDVIVSIRNSTFVFPTMDTYEWVI